MIEQLSYNSDLVKSIRVFFKVFPGDHQRNETMVIIMARACAFHQWLTTLRKRFTLKNEKTSVTSLMKWLTRSIHKRLKTEETSVTSLMKRQASLRNKHEIARIERQEKRYFAIRYKKKKKKYD